MATKTKAKAKVNLPDSFTNPVKIEIVITPEMEQCIELGKTCLIAGNSLRDTFRNFIVTIRKFLPKEQRVILEKAGFEATRISKMLKIATLPDEHFKPYQDGQIGFNATVDKAREVASAKSGKARKQIPHDVIMRAAIKVHRKLKCATNIMVMPDRRYLVIIAPFAANTENPVEQTLTPFLVRLGIDKIE